MFELERDGIRLAGVDAGGDGPAVLLLHGLAGHTGEWDATIAALGDRFRVVALDARGHGRSDRRPADVSRQAHVGDVVAVIERLGLAPAAIVGQSLGGQTALLAAAARPDLARCLVVAEAGPGKGLDPEAIDRVGERLAAWPLERRRHFDVDVMVRTLREADCRDYWDAWERIACPVLIVRAAVDGLPEDVAQEMTARLPGAQVAEIAGAGHDLHLDRPQEWVSVLRGFLSGGS